MDVSLDLYKRYINLKGQSSKGNVRSSYSSLAKTFKAIAFLSFLPYQKVCAAVGEKI
jgi:hypothetical protein